MSADPALLAYLAAQLVALAAAGVAARRWAAPFRRHH